MGAHPDSPLITQLNDIVTWNNTTHQKHWPWPVDVNHNLLPDSAVSVKMAMAVEVRLAHQ
jgi:hypothetical protein